MMRPLFAPPLRLPATRSASAALVSPRRRGARRMYRATASQLIQPPSPAVAQQTGQVRVRQHLNPLARRWSRPITLPDDWYATAFEDTALPLVVDLGVAKGRFLLKMAQKERRFNFLGIEIREPLVHQANRCAEQLGLGNLFYLAGNANVSLLSILDGCPDGVLQQLLIQFCDPWFKKRHAKRRMVNEALVRDIHHILCKSRGASHNFAEPRVFVQSDVLEVATEMTERFDQHGGFSRLENDHDLRVDRHGWLLRNPLGVATEREIAVTNKGLPVYRALYQIDAHHAT
ncbi:tRNA (guanine(46)-N(7))-methyltransferase [Gracilaria domingensis]|nr:tRNA (guanine(46)-N(7))-methyltransferase [Gracilaria domingensis]